LDENMYKLFLDESGDWGYPSFHPEQPVLCICGCIFNEEYYSKEIVPLIKGKKRQVFRRDVVLHRTKVHARVKDFSTLKNDEKLDKFIQDFSKCISELEFTMLLSAINKADHYRTYGLKRVDNYLPEDIYSMIFTFIVERFVHFLREISENGKIIAESRGRKEDQKVQYWYSSIMNNGTQFIQSWQFRDVLPTAIEFMKKEDNIEGLQISDWIALPMAKMIRHCDFREDKYNEWCLYKDKIWIGKQAPDKGQIGFKVFPKNLGRKLLNMPIKSAKDF